MKNYRVRRKLRLEKECIRVLADSELVVGAGGKTDGENQTKGVVCTKSCDTCDIGTVFTV